MNSPVRSRLGRLEQTLRPDGRVFFVFHDSNLRDG